MRLAVYTDYPYSREDDTVFAERAFALFMASLARGFECLTVVGRLRPEPGRSHYRLPYEVRFVPLPHHRGFSRPVDASLPMIRSLRRFWRVLDSVDGAWLLGPSPLSIAFVLLARIRGKRVVLGVRQDLPRYVFSRYPDRRWIRAAALALEAAFRMLARFYPVVVVGPDLARRYRSAPRLLEIAVSLVKEDEIASIDDVRRSYDGELRILSVGRLEEEKNPLMLADVLAMAREHDPRYRFVVCGDGPLEGGLSRRLSDLGVGAHAELRGYVPIDGGLRALYRDSHALLHVSRTEGLPQVLFEAFAAGLPVVATAVGGIPEAVGDSVLLVPPDDAEAAASALGRLVSDHSLRARLIESGIECAHKHTIDSESGRLIRFLGGVPVRTAPPPP